MMQHDPRWPAALLRFASRPAQYAHPSWLPEWAAGLPAPLPERLERELSTWLLEELDLDAEATERLTSVASRLFMLERNALRALALALGVARHRRPLRQVVLQAQLEQLRGALGEAIDTLWSPLTDAVQAAEHPLALVWSRFDAAALRTTLEQDGLQTLLTLFDPADPTQIPAARRAALCLPRATTQGPLAPLPASQSAALAQALAAHAVPTQAPAWTWLF